MKIFKRKPKKLIQDIESNAGWYADNNVAFKVAYIEEVVE